MCEGEKIIFKAYECDIRINEHYRQIDIMTPLVHDISESNLKKIEERKKMIKKEIENRTFHWETWLEHFEICSICKSS